MDMNEVLERSFDLLDSYREASEDNEKQSLLKKYVAEFDKVKSPTVPEFAEGLDWFNVSKPLSFAGLLKGKVVLLDFFTYCCINCLHILPDLHALEDAFPESSGLLILGVHSAKFDNEKDSGNIRNAILRYHITHPVVNDAEGSLWSSLIVHCWPTLVLVGPRGELLLSLAGEGHRPMLQSLLPLVLKYYRDRGTLSDHTVGISLEKNSLKPSPLLYPGKVALDPTGRRLAIADTAHHRIVVTDTLGNVQESIGGTEPGLRSGSLKSALFNSPQGIVWKDNCLYVADTENHMIRKIDLDARTVSTIAGTGVQGQDKEGGHPGPEQPISSPWDLALCSSVNGEEDAVLLIAMAGTHQIWVYFLQDCEWVQGMKHPAGTCVRFAGSGNEENRNNAYARKASFAQPSGLALGSFNLNKELFVADSESSSVRSISLADGAVKGVIGGAADPMNLFAYGDIDGKGRDAKLQHPLGVAVRTKEDGSQSLLVADSYNHKIKEVDLVTKQAVTIINEGIQEPGGLCVDPSGKWLYIADTNNHAVKVLNLESHHLSQLVITFPTETDGSRSSPVRKNRKPPKSAIIRQEPVLELNLSCDTCLELAISLADGLHLTEGASAQWKVYSKTDDDITVFFSEKSSFEGTFDTLDKQPKWTLRPSNGIKDTEVTVEARIFYCDEQGTCRVTVVAFIIPIRTVSGSENSQIDRTAHQLQYEVAIS